MPIRHPHRFGKNLENLDPEVNPYVAKIKENLDKLPIYLGDKLHGRPGTWQKEISTLAQNPLENLYLEIGSYKGKTIVDYSIQKPTDAFIGMDITLKRIYLSADKANKLGCANCAWILANGQILNQLFAPAELSGVFLFFPDPWQKKARQKKNRIISPEFCSLLTQVLRPQGFFWFKTDCKEYFLEGTSFLNAAGLIPQLEQEPHLFKLQSETVFEGLFKRQGLAIYSGVWYNNKDTVCP